MLNMAIADELTEQAFETNWGDTWNTSVRPIAVPVFDGPSDVGNEGGTTTTQSISCTRADQTSIPQRALRALLQKRKLDLYHNASTGKLTIDGGAMIGNCINMLKFNFKRPTGGRPYIFNVSIKKPTEGCQKNTKTGIEKCSYEAYTASQNKNDDKPLIDDSPISINVEPNYYGFKECLKKTKVMKPNGKIDPSKIASKKFFQEYSGVNETQKVIYYCSGPLCDAPKTRMQSEPAIKAGECQWFEDVAKGGYKVYSVADQKFHNRKDLFQNICNTGNYRVIEDHLPSFKEFGDMHDSLKQIRNNLIIKQVKQLHKTLNKQKNYSKLNPDEFKQIIKDFYDKIILPKQKKIQAQIVYVDGLPSGKKRNAAVKKLNEMVIELTKLVKKPYLTVNDYKSMQSFIKKAPLKADAWRDAALVLFKSTNTAFHYTRFSEPLKKKYEKKYEVADASPDEVLIFIEQDTAMQKDRLDKLGVLANDTTGNVSFAHEAKVAAEDIHINHGNELRLLQQELQYEKQYERKTCYNSTGGMWGLTQQNCIRNSRQIQQDIMSQTSYMNSPQYLQQAVYPQIQTHMALSDEWARIEAERNRVYGISPQPFSSRLQSDPRALMNPQAAQNFTNDPRFMQSMTQANAQGSVYQQMALQNQQQYSFQNQNNYRAPSSYSTMPSWQTPAYNNNSWQFR